MDDASSSIKEFAAFHKASLAERKKLKEKYIAPVDRDLLNSAFTHTGNFLTSGALIGLGFGVLVASRRASRRKAVLDAFRAHEKPVVVIFANGRTEPIPNMRPLLKPDILGAIASHLVFSTCGLLLGGFVGGITGSGSAEKALREHPEALARLQAAQRKINAELIRKEADWLDERRRVSDRLLELESESEGLER